MFSWTQLQQALDQCVAKGGIEPTAIHMSRLRHFWMQDQWYGTSIGMNPITYNGMRIITRLEDAVPGDRVLCVTDDKD
ncbi:MAG: hypothetical protein NVS1B10_06390 [Candidatus Saccharimonadales bacterium]